MRLLISLMTLVFCLGFAQMPESHDDLLSDIKNPKIKAEVAQKLNETRISQAKDCRKSMLRKAEAHVDSLIAIQLNASQSRLSDLNIPNKPSRPDKTPEFNIGDSSTIRPYFKEIDTLLQ